MSGAHFSDCAVHNEPAMPAGPCDCGILPHQQRMLDELAELHDRMTKLDKFLAGLDAGAPTPPGVDQYEIDLMACQLAAMSAYHAALHASVRRWRG